MKTFSFLLLFVLCASVSAIQFDFEKHALKRLRHALIASVNPLRVRTRWALNYPTQAIHKALKAFKQHYHTQFIPGVSAAAQRAECEAKRVTGTVKECPAFKDIYHTVQLKWKKK